MPPYPGDVPPHGPTPADVAAADDGPPRATIAPDAAVAAARVSLASQAPEGAGSTLLQAARATQPDRSGAHDLALERFGRRTLNTLHRPDHPERREVTDAWRGVSDDGDVPVEIVAGALDLLCDGADGKPPSGRTAPNLAALVRRYPTLTIPMAQRALTVARQRIADGIAASASSEGAMIKDAIWRCVEKAELAGRYDHALAGLRTLAAIQGLSQAGESQVGRASRLTDAELDAEIDRHVAERIAAKPAAEIARIREGVDLLAPAGAGSVTR